MKWITSNWRVIVMALAGIDVVGNAVIKYIEANPKTDWHGLLIAVGMALFAWLKTGPGDLTKSQAEQLAEKRAADAVRRSVPPSGGD